MGAREAPQGRCLCWEAFVAVELWDLWPLGCALCREGLRSSARGVWRDRVPGLCWAVQLFGGRQKNCLHLRSSHPKTGLSWRTKRLQEQILSIVRPVNVKLPALPAASHWGRWLPSSSPLAMEEVCVGGPMTCQRPMTSYWWGFSLGVWPNNVIFIGGHSAAPLFRTAWAVVLDSRESRSVFCSWPGHLAGAFTSGSPPSSSWRAFTSLAASPAVTLLPPSSFSGLPLCSPSDPSKEARCLSAE